MDMGDQGSDWEMAMAVRALKLARFRVAQDALFHGGRVDRDLDRRLRDALARVRYLETRAAA